MSPYNEQWSGHGQKEMPDMFRELVEKTPQLPIDKIARFIKNGFIWLLAMITGKKKRKPAQHQQPAVNISEPSTSHL